MARSAAVAAMLHTVTDSDIRAVGPAALDAPRAADGRLRADIANALVRLYKEHYGRGPTIARTFIEEQYVFCVLEEGLTRNELTLIDGGQEELVRTYRARFNQVIDPLVCQLVEQLTGRRVLTHDSQLTFGPARTFEVFVLDAPVAAPSQVRAA